MYRNTSSFAAFLVALLVSSRGNSGVFVQAISTSEHLQNEHALSPHVLDAFSQAGGNTPAEAYDGIAFISGQVAPVRTYEEIAERMRRRREENERRQQAWEKEQAAGGIGDGTARTPIRYGPSHPFYKQYVLERMRQRAERRRKLQEAAGTPTEKKQVAEEEDTSEIYKNTIRACVLSGKIDRHEFCERTGSLAECEDLLNFFERSNSFKKLKFHPLTYTVNVNGKFFTASLPVFDTYALKFLVQLDYSLSQVCNYDTKTFRLVLLSFEDAVDSSFAGERVWDLSRSSEGDVLVSAIGALKKAFSVSVPHYIRLYELAVELTTILVKAGSLRYTFPLLARFFNFACRSRRICRSVLHELVRRHLYHVRGAATADISAGSSPQLTEELKKTLQALFDGRLERLAKNGAATVSGWLTQSTKAILEPKSDT